MYITWSVHLNDVRIYILIHTPILQYLRWRRGSTCSPGKPAIGRYLWIPCDMLHWYTLIVWIVVVKYTWWGFDQANMGVWCHGMYWDMRSWDISDNMICGLVQKPENKSLPRICSNCNMRNVNGEHRHELPGFGPLGVPYFQRIHVVNPTGFFWGTIQKYTIYIPSGYLT